MRQIAKTLGINRRTVKKAITTRGGLRYHRTVPYVSILDPFKTEIIPFSVENELLFFLKLIEESGDALSQPVIR